MYVLKYVHLYLYFTEWFHSISNILLIILIATIEIMSIGGIQPAT